MTIKKIIMGPVSQEITSTRNNAALIYMKEKLLSLKWDIVYELH